MFYTPIYAALLALWYLKLSVGVIRIRHRERIALQDGGRDDLNRAIRAHGNFAEYVPLLMLLLLCLEMQHGHWLLVNLLGLMVLAGRVLHARGLLYDEPVNGSFKSRMAGMILTFTSLGVLALANLGLALKALAAG